MKFYLGWFSYQFHCIFYSKAVYCALFMLLVWCQGVRLQRWIMSCSRGAYILEAVVACTVNSGTIQGVGLPRLQIEWEHSDEFCCTRWKEDQASIHWEGHALAASERKIRSFLNRGNCWYPGQKEQRCKSTWAAEGDNPRATAVIEECQGRVSEVKLGETVKVLECHMERVLFTSLGTLRGAESPIHLYVINMPQ